MLSMITEEEVQLVETKKNLSNYNQEYTDPESIKSQLQYKIIKNEKSFRVPNLIHN